MRPQDDGARPVDDCSADWDHDCMQAMRTRIGQAQPESQAASAAVRPVTVDCASDAGERCCCRRQRPSLSQWQSQTLKPEAGGAGAGPGAARSVACSVRMRPHATASPTGRLARLSAARGRNPRRLRLRPRAQRPGPGALRLAGDPTRPAESAPAPRVGRRIPDARAKLGILFWLAGSLAGPGAACGTRAVTRTRMIPGPRPIPGKSGVGARVRRPTGVLLSLSQT